MTKPADLITADDIATFEVVTNQTPNEPDTTQKRKLDELLGELNDSTDNCYVALYRQPNGAKASLILLEQFPVDKYDTFGLWNFLRDNYGPGDYRIHVRENGKLRANNLMTIEAKKTVEKNGPTPVGEASNILNTVLERMERQNNLIMQMMQQQQQPQQSRQDFYQEMLLMKQIFDSGNQNSGNAMQQLRDSMDLLKEMGVTINGEAKEKEEPGFGDLLEKMTPLITASMGQPQSSENPSKPKPKVDPQKMMLKAGLASLLNAAQKNSDQITYGEWILDQVPEETVKNYITSDGAFEKLIEIEPRVAQHKQWFLDLGEHVKAQLGLPSKFAELYNSFESDITGETDTKIESENG